LNGTKSGTKLAPMAQLEALIGDGKLTYQGWEIDVEEFAALHQRYSLPLTNNGSELHPGDTVLGEWILESRLQGMLHKNEAFLGDRSHPHLKALDALVAQLHYPGWPQDFQVALQSHYRHDNEWNRQRAIFRLNQRQRVFQGDRSHPRMVELDHLASKLTYPGHDRDVKQCEEMHFNFTDDYVGNNVLSRQFQSLRNRQAHWDGTLSCKALDALRSQLTYDGWQEDIHAAMGARLEPCSILESSGQVMDYNTALQQLQHKQSVLQDRDRSHPRLVALDKLLSAVSINDIPHCERANRNQLVQELEQVHLRYATDDWMGDAIFERILQALRQLHKQQERTKKFPSVPSTPSKMVFKKKQEGSPFSVASNITATTVTTIFSSWSHSSGDYDYTDHHEVEGRRETMNPMCTM
jgi:hypothetical protein